MYFMKHSFKVLLEKILSSRSKDIEIEGYGVIFDISKDEYEALKSLLDLIEVFRNIVTKKQNVEEMRSATLEFIRSLEDLKIYSLIENEQYDLLSEKIKQIILLYQI